MQGKAMSINFADHLIMEAVLAYIQSLGDFSATSWNILSPALTTMSVEKGDYLLKKGQVCDALFFINQGFCRAFYEQGEQEINTDFFFERDIATNITSFAKGIPSEFALQACEDLIVVRFDKSKLREAGRLDPAIETLGRNCLQQIAMRQEKHNALFKLMTAEERYAHLEQHSPAILQRVSLSQLSSYLGVARETLSRIRKRRMSA